MKIIFTGDNHVFYGDQRQAVLEMMEAIRHEKPDVVCNVGDIGEVLMDDGNTTLIKELFSIKPTLFVPGNHDLYSHSHYVPPQGMSKFLEVMKCFGYALQTCWTDSVTIYETSGCLFLGTMGFPDFAHPKMIMPIHYYDDRCPTVDGTYMNLQGGFLQYTRTLIDAFEKKLQLVDISNCSNIIIITHYPIFESQYHLNPTEDISVYFYCHKIGQLVKQASQKNPHKKFYCVAGHGHEYNLGQWIMDGNIYSHGLVTTYNDQKYIMLDIPATIE